MLRQTTTKQLLCSPAGPIRLVGTITVSDTISVRLPTETAALMFEVEILPGLLRSSNKSESIKMLTLKGLLCSGQAAILFSETLKLTP
jgi:hypothetical protein